MADSKACTLRTRKFITNRLLERKQFVVDVLHPGRASVPKAELKEKLAKMYKVSDEKCIFLHGFKIAFGGQRSTGFGLIYDSVASAEKSLAKYLLYREGIQTKPQSLNRKSIKERKTKIKKVRGIAKETVRSGKAPAKKNKKG